MLKGFSLKFRVEGSFLHRRLGPKSPIGLLGFRPSAVPPLSSYSLAEHMLNQKKEGIFVDRKDLTIAFYRYFPGGPK